MKMKFRKQKDKVRTQMTFLNGGVDGCSYFSLIFSYCIFYPKSFLSWVGKYVFCEKYACM